MTRAVYVASLLTVLSVTQVAQAQAYDSAFRFGLGLDYAGLVGRNDGGAGGLRLTLGARLHEHFGVYYQGQALAGAFASSDDILATFMGWNAVLAEANLEIFSLGLGPSFDVTVRCTFPTSQASAATGACTDYVAPGLAARAGLRFDVLTFSGDIHVTFDDDQGPDVWVLLGVGMTLGDSPSAPRTMPSSAEPYESRRRRASRRDVPRRTERVFTADVGLGLRLDDPHPESSHREPSPAAEREALRERVEPERESPALYRPPEVRRFESRDVHLESDAAPGEALPEEVIEPSEPSRLEGLRTPGSDDPLEGLESAGR